MVPQGSSFSPSLIPFLVISLLLMTSITICFYMCHYVQSPQDLLQVQWLTRRAHETYHLSQSWMKFVTAKAYKKSTKGKMQMRQSLKETRHKFSRFFSQWNQTGVAQLLQPWSVVIHVKPCLPGKLIRDSAQRIFIGTNTVDVLCLDTFCLACTKIPEYHSEIKYSAQVTLFILSLGTVRHYCQFWEWWKTFWNLNSQMPMKG